MKQIPTLLYLVLFSQLIQAQSFTEETNSLFSRVLFSAAAFADIDGDGDEDLIITGQEPGPGANWDEISKLYRNKGGQFEEVLGTPFVAVEHSTVAFSDVDGDGDKDVLITGKDNANYKTAILYTNEGGTFTKVLDTPFQGVMWGTTSFSDIDSDGDEDVLISGRNSNGESTTLYTNDQGSFTEVKNTPFEHVSRGSIEFSDIDGDGDEDVLITGVNVANETIAKLYTNDYGIFTEVPNTPFDGVSFGSIAFSDVDLDGDQDVLITGTIASGFESTILYSNENGVFSKVLDTPFDQVNLSAVAFSDVDNDGDEDLFILGEDSIGSTYSPISKLYINNAGEFSEATESVFQGLFYGSVDFSDVDNDGDQDLFITGQINISDGARSILYKNDLFITHTNELPVDIYLKLEAFPNPSRAPMLHVCYQSSKVGDVTVSIFNSKGDFVLQQRESRPAGEQLIHIDVTTLPAGSYFLELNEGAKRGQVSFVVPQN